MPAQPHPALRLAPACADVPGALVGVRPEPRAKGIVRLVCTQVAYAIRETQRKLYGGRPVHAACEPAVTCFNRKPRPLPPRRLLQLTVTLAGCRRDLVRQKQRGFVQ